MLSKDAAPFPEVEICLIESLYLLNIILKSACTEETEEKLNFWIKANIYKLQTGSFLLKLRMDIHSLPFSIGFNGEAEVDSAFPFKIDSKSNSAESAFRGRKLAGQFHELPSNLSGNVISIALRNVEFYLVTIGKIEKSKNIISIECNEKEVNMIIEWNKADIPEPSKIDLDNFNRLSHLQSKVFQPCVYNI